MKILTLSDQPDRPETVLLQGLIDRGHEVGTLIAPGAALAVPFSQRKELRLTSRISPPAIRWLSQNLPRYDLVHCFTARALTNTIFASILGRLTVPICAYRGTVGHLDALDPTSWLSFRNPRVRAISCVSEAVRRYLEPRVSPHVLLRTIYKGHAPEWYSAVVPADLSEFGISPHSAVVSFVGNMRSVKGADLLVDAFSVLEHPNAHLLLIGEVRDSNVRRAIERSQLAHRIHLLGRRSDTFSLVRASSVFVMPSRDREGFPKAVLEAMMLRRPVIVTNAGGMPEMVRHEVDGLVVERNQVAALADALRIVLGEPGLAERMGCSAGEHARQQFSVTQTIDQTEALFAAVLSLNTAGPNTDGPSTDAPNTT